MVIGKLRPETLKKYVFNRVGVIDPRVLVGPSIGEDAAVIDIGNDKVLIAHVDPISGANEYIGWLAVHVPSNDVAVSGAKPQWLLPVLYLPENSDDELIDRITDQMNLAAREISAMIVGGHSEFTAGIKRPLISMTSIGMTSKDKYIISGGAKPGDAVLMTKSAGVEGTAVLASDFRDLLLSRGVDSATISNASKMIKNISVVKDALILAEDNLPTAMHDPTEGGILGGALELAYASNTSITIHEESIPVAKETAIICEALNIDPLRMLSSGTLLASVPVEKLDYALKKLRNGGLNASVIGEVTKRGDFLVKILRKDGRAEIYNDVYVADEVMRLWST
ncbi:MAG: AIR synthase family protein [Sulfolobales archaeon]|nr:AIR synthase family protein [Sulfolobales archaeon]MDW7969817.1 AIR synthase family protein [Sulfolobales archaeon]